jgi:hypothetical protein
MIVLVALACLTAALVARMMPRGGTRGESRRRFAQKKLVTANEREFFFRLRDALPGYLVFPQVAMGALLATAAAADGTERLGARAKFAQKIVDYVVCSSNLEVICLVELDDRTHNVARDVARDAMTAQAGYRTVRFESRNKPDASEIRRQVLRINGLH